MGRSGSIRMPPGPTTSGIGPTFWAMIGVPHAAASRRVSPKPSDHAVERKMSALEDLRAAFSGGLNIFTDHEHKVDNVFGRSDSAEIRASGEKDPKTGAPIYDLHIAGFVNTPNPRMAQLADSMESGITFGASIGARLREHKRNKAGGFDIHHLEGKEASLVGIPMNQRSWTYKSALIGRAVSAAERLGDNEIDDDDDEDETEKSAGSLSTAAHVRAALSRVADPDNDQSGRDEIIAAARRMGIGDHKGLNDDDLVTWASIEYPSVDITKDDDGEEVFIVKALDTTEGDPLIRQDLEGPKEEKSDMCPDCGNSHEDAGDCGNSFHTLKSADEADIHTHDSPADGQESGSAEADTPETPETASAAEDEDAEKAFTFEAEDVIVLAKKARDLAQMVNDRDAEIEVLKAERDRLASENEDAKSALEKIVAMPLRRKAVYATKSLSDRLPDYFAPEVKEFLTKSAGEHR
jgi:hypothetical protein